MILPVFILIVFFSFLFFFAVFPRILITHISELLTFYSKKDAIKRSNRIFSTYIFLGIILSYTFTIIFGFNQKSIELLVPEGYMTLFSFVTAFLLIFSIRIMVLIEKEGYIKKMGWINSVSRPLFHLKRNYCIDRKKELFSFLFSMLLLAVLSSIIYYLFNSVSKLKMGDIVGWGWSDVVSSILIFLIFLSLTIGSIYLLVFIGETILGKCEIHGEHIDGIT